MNDPSDLKSRVLGHLAGGIAHDLNNALQTIVGALTTIEKLIEMDHLEKAPRFIAAAVRSAHRGGELTRHLQRLAQRKPDGATSVELNSLVRSLEDLLRRICGGQITLQLELADGAREVKCDPGELECVLLTLVINAADADSEAITIRTRDARIDVTAQQSFEWEFAEAFANRYGAQVRLDGTTVTIQFPGVLASPPGRPV
jgi:C4-dicarboxylate-specific signal transduction histidine kinase